MKETVISVTEAAHNFSECISRVYYQEVPFVLMKNGTPVARLVPEHAKVCSGRDLDNAKLPAAEVKAWLSDLRAARRKLKAPVDKWR